MKLCRRKTNNGTPIWVIDYYEGGKRRRESLGNIPKSEAQVAYAMRVQDLELRRTRGRRSANAREAESLTLADLLGWECERSDISEATRSQKKAKAANLLKHFGADFAVMGLTPAMLDAYRKKRTLEGVKPRTINMELCDVLRTAINRAIENEILDHAPCKIKDMTVERRTKRALTRDEVAKIVEALGRCKHQRLVRDATVLMVNTGLRVGEVEVLEWGQIDLGARTLTLLSKKRGATAYVEETELPLNADAVKILKERKRCSRGKIVFPGLTRYSLGRALKNAGKIAGVSKPEDIGPHVLRHTFCTLLADAGDVTLPDAQALMRHRDPKMTLHYMHSRKKGMRAAVEKLTVKVGSPVIHGKGDDKQE